MAQALPSPLTAFCDGGSRGNPGPSGFGVSIEGPAGEPVAELSEFLGTRTNNYAEYQGLLAALAWALEHGCDHLRVVADSELMVKQMKGQYRVNSPDLKPLHEEAKRRAGQLKRFEIQHVLRGKNKNADRLANEAMDRGTGRGPRVEGAGRAPAGGQRAEGGSKAAPAEAPVRLGVSRLDRQAAAASAPSQPGAAVAAPAPPRELPAEVTGFVKNGVVHLVEGELPEGTFVRVLPARR